ncbi:MAG: hypothetical protein H8D78_08085 [Chloroflexi bacterium]|nr:hypothetical protein [Chloroflexota bacterium]
MAPHQDDLAYRPEQVLPRIREGLRAFVGMTAFEELSRQWVAEQGRVGALPFEVGEVGSHSRFLRFFASRTWLHRMSQRSSCSSRSS